MLTSRNKLRCFTLIVASGKKCFVHSKNIFIVDTCFLILFFFFFLSINPMCYTFVPLSISYPKIALACRVEQKHKLVVLLPVNTGPKMQQELEFNATLLDMWKSLSALYRYKL